MSAKWQASSAMLQEVSSHPTTKAFLIQRATEMVNFHTAELQSWTDLLRQLQASNEAKAGMSPQIPVKKLTPTVTSSPNPKEAEAAAQPVATDASHSSDNASASAKKPEPTPPPKSAAKPPASAEATASTSSAASGEGDKEAAAAEAKESAQHMRHARKASMSGMHARRRPAPKKLDYVHHSASPAGGITTEDTPSAKDLTSPDGADHREASASVSGKPPGDAEPSSAKPDKPGEGGLESVGIKFHDDAAEEKDKPAADGTSPVQEPENSSKPKPKPPRDPPPVKAQDSGNEGDKTGSPSLDPISPAAESSSPDGDMSPGPKLPAHQKLGMNPMGGAGMAELMAKQNKRAESGKKGVPGPPPPKRDGDAAATTGGEATPEKPKKPLPPPPSGDGGKKAPPPMPKMGPPALPSSPPPKTVDPIDDDQPVDKLPEEGQTAPGATGESGLASPPPAKPSHQRMGTGLPGMAMGELALKLKKREDTPGSGGPKPPPPKDAPGITRAPSETAQANPELAAKLQKRTAANEDDGKAGAKKVPPPPLPKQASQSAPKCPECGCGDFKPDSFKPKKCSNCFHNHVP